ncbi:cold-shock protein [Thiocystis violacea]|uniref:cold-shock protein n=1 Tax=Thiocystis violacea TaxID=13725 RepID=UPI00190782CE|nr:cold shock domain-containing protein [Thiocystis violacea]MBK1718620.1 hypothetical protein [Thiocystis violacea]
MEGTVVSFVPDKRYGFLAGADGCSYFFHLSAFRPPQPSSAIGPGMLISFDPTPSPKGLRAQSLRIEPTHAIQLVAPASFLVTKADRPRSGCVLSEIPRIECRSDVSIETAKAAVIALAVKLGANALLGLSYHRERGSEGNYIYSIHGYSGTPAIVMDERLTTNAEDIRRGEQAASVLVARLKNGYLEEQERLKTEKENLWLGIRFIAGLFLLIVVALVVLY